MSLESTTNETRLPVFLIYSGWSLPKIDNFLSEYGEAGFLRIIYEKNHKETNRNLAILSEETFTALCSEGYNTRRYGGDFLIARFVLRENNFPKSTHSFNFYIPVPQELIDEDVFVVNAIEDKLKYLSEWEIIPVNSWSIKVPLKSRETGGIRSGCFVKFKKEVENNNIAMARLLINDTYWPSLDNNVKDRANFKCFWARLRTPPIVPTNVTLIQ